MVDASADTLQFSVKATTTDLAVHRQLWLKQWHTDAKSTAILANDPFKGSKLFRKGLEDALLETRDRNRALPNKQVKRKGQKNHYSSFWKGSFNCLFDIHRAAPSNWKGQHTMGEIPQVSHNAKKRRWKF